VRSLSLVLWVALILSGCGPEGVSSRIDRNDSDSVLVHQAGDWIPAPALHLNFPQLPFTSRVPKDAFQIDEADSGAGTGIRLMATFGGVLTPSAFALVYVSTLPHSEEGSARATLFGMLEEDGLVRDENTPVPPCLWAEESFYFRSLREDLEGYACYAQKDNVPFYLYVQYPRTFSDGMNNHLDVLLRHWRWRSDGTPLEHPPL